MVKRMRYEVGVVGVEIDEGLPEGRRLAEAAGLGNACDAPVRGFQRLAGIVQPPAKHPVCIHRPDKQDTYTRLRAIGQAMSQRG